MPGYESMSKKELVDLLEKMDEERAERAGKGDPERLLHELQVHQVELEMQNRELKETRDRIEEVLSKYADLYDFAPIGYMTLSKSGIIEETNLTAACMLGVERGKLVSKSFLKFLDRGYVNRFLAELDRCCPDNGLTLEAGLNTNRGRFDAELHIIKASREGAFAYRVTLTDITRRKKAEEEARKLSMLVEQSPSMAIIMDAECRIEYVNRRFTELTGYSREYAIGKDPSFLASGRHPKEFFDEMWGKVCSGEIWQGDVCSRKKNGALFWTHLSVSPIKGGDATRLAVTEVYDAERKRAEEALASERDLLSGTMRSIGEGVMTLDDSRKVTFLNAEAERLTGWTSREAVGKGFNEVFNVLCETTGAPVGDPMKLLSDEKGPPGKKLILRGRKGDQREVAGRAALITDSAGKIKGSVVVFMEAREAEGGLDKAHEALSRGVIHEMNNSLNAVHGGLELAREVQPKEASSLLKSADETLSKLMELTEELRIISTQARPSKEVTYIDDLVRESAETALKGSAVELDASFPESIWFVEADARQIRQAFANIFRSSVESMQGRGRIKVRCGNEDLREGELPGLGTGKFVRVSMMDSGPPLPEEVLNTVFDPFFAAKQSGTRLGLSIADSIIKGHGGEMKAGVAEGGTAFDVWLPAFEFQRKEEGAAA
ncbi:MAG: PAS domain S-box protein [Deltaproteobacteria bacterium]|nr:PAS domain S-box protein [Deltaproteobacteria bacterium]